MRIVIHTVKKLDVKHHVLDYVVMDATQVVLMDVVDHVPHVQVLVHHVLVIVLVGVRVVVIHVQVVVVIHVRITAHQDVLVVVVTHVQDVLDVLDVLVLVKSNAQVIVYQDVKDVVHHAVTHAHHVVVHVLDHA